MPSQSKYYPNLTGKTLQDLLISCKLAFRQTFDFLYLLRDQVGPLTIIATRPTEDVTITTDPKVGIVNLSLTRTGLWMIQGIVHIKITGDGGQIFRVQLVAGNNQAAGAGNAPVIVTVPGQGVLVAADGAETMVVQAWVVLAAKDTVAQLFVSKDAGGGTSVAVKNDTTFTATWAGVA